MPVLWLCGSVCALGGGNLHFSGRARHHSRTQGGGARLERASVINNFLSYARGKRLKNRALRENGYAMISDDVEVYVVPNFTSAITMAMQQHQGNKKGELLCYFLSEMI